MSEYATKREPAAEYAVIRVTWWNGHQWCVTHEIVKAARIVTKAGKA